MAYIKSAADIEALKEGGAIIGAILESLAAMVAPGVSGKEIDDVAEQKVREAGGVPAFKHYRPRPSDSPFPSTICFSINDEVVHGFGAADKVIQAGDIVTIDIGMKYKGLFTDTAVTVAAGEIDEQKKQLLAVTKKAMWKGIAAATVGAPVSVIGKVVQEYIDPQGYGIVRDLCGHGVGHEVHEDPNVLNYYDSSLDRWTLEHGVVIAIEPMITMGDYRVTVDDDNWTIRTADRKPSAHFEHTVVVTNDGPLVVTLRPSEKSGLV